MINALANSLSLSTSVMEKETYRFTNNKRKISFITFEVTSDVQVKEQAHIKIDNEELFHCDDDDNTPLRHGPLDPRLGIIQDGHSCQTCGEGVDTCLGHFGYINLNLPVFHPAFMRFIVDILQTICKNCSHVLLEKKEDREFRSKVAGNRLSYAAKKSLRVKIRNEAKKIKNCPNCGHDNDTVKKYDANNIRYLNSTGGDENMMALCPLIVYSLFERIPQRDIPLLLMNPETSHPKNLILKNIPVPPICIRPTSKLTDHRVDGNNEDDLTVKLSDIVRANDIVGKDLESGADVNKLADDWRTLQNHCFLYMKGKVEYIPGKKPKAIISLAERLKGKKGRIRSALSGKRVDYTARSVISPDPNLKIGYVGVPLPLAKKLTFPERVTDLNLDYMRKLVRNGFNIHPGANYVRKSTGQLISLEFGNKDFIAQRLKPRDIVERHLEGDDFILLNRQPSLHKSSLLAHRAKITRNETFTFNVCTCTPFNADFDGDEMNLHLPQTEEARAEGVVLTNCTSNLLSPNDGKLLIAATQDFITSGYLLTQKDVFFTKAQAWELASCMLSEDDWNLNIDFPPPAIFHPTKLWTGKQIISSILRPNEECVVELNLRVKGKSYSGNNEELCTNDSYVVIYKSELLAGSLDKLTLGPASRKTIFYALLRDWGADYATRVMWRLGRLASYYLMNRGFSLGIDDVKPSEKLLEEKRAKISEKHKAIAKSEVSYLDEKTASVKKREAENFILATLSKIRDDLGEACMRELHSSNSARIMAACGSKGSVKNISQMIMSVGQQVVKGCRLSNGLFDRSLPHFEPFSNTPAARGFVDNSFFSGLQPTEFIFHTMCGRDGLTDTVIQTSETGYMQRRMMKCMEDLSVLYDNSVRDSRKNVVQLQFGEDGLDPTYVETKEFPVNLSRILNHIQISHQCKNEESLGIAVVERGKQILKEKEYKIFEECYRESIIKFLEDFTSAKKTTLSQLRTFLTNCRENYETAVIEPGTAVGAIAAQSIGEPSTQMTLNSFHHAGMDVTGGFTRLKEIVDANSKVENTAIQVYLENEEDEEDIRFAETVKRRIQATTIEEICEVTEEYDEFGFCTIVLKLNEERLRLLNTRVTPKFISEKLLENPKVSRMCQTITAFDNEVIIWVPKEMVLGPFPNLHSIAEIIRKTVIQGFESVKQVKIKHESAKYMLEVKHDKLLDVLATRGVVASKTKSNNIGDVCRTLGIEAARATLINELKMLLTEDDELRTDIRHIMLLADHMTSGGVVRGSTRFGLGKFKESVISQASFEEAETNLINAAYFGQKDLITGVSESIIVGAPITIGTGSFQLISPLTQ